MKISAVVSSLVLCICFVALLSAEVNTPTAGILRYADGSVRTIYGIQTNYIIGPQLFTSIDAASFSDSGGLIAGNGQIQLVKSDGALVGQYDSSEPRPVLNIDGDLQSAIAWLPSRQALLKWTGHSFTLVQLPENALGGEVTSLRVSGPNSADLLISEPEGTVSRATVSLDSGELTAIQPIPAIKAPAFEQGSYLIFHDDQGLEVEDGSGAIRNFPLSAPDLQIERMSSDSLHLASPNRQQNWILRLREANVQLWELPTPAAELAKGSGK